MSGSIYKGYNDSNTPTAEYNVAFNVTAAQIMFGTTFYRSSILAAPLDTSGVIFIAGQQYASLVSAQETNALIKAIMENYYFYSGNKTSSFSTILYDVEAAQLLFSTEYLSFEELPIIVNNSGYTIIDYDNGITAIWAIQWTNLISFTESITERLLGWRQSMSNFSLNNI